MNANRRKRIAELSARASAMRDELDAIRGDLEAIRDEEQEAFDALPESLQLGERGDAMQQAIDALENASGESDTARDALESIETYLSEARGE